MPLRIKIEDLPKEDASSDDASREGAVLTDDDLDKVSGGLYTTSPTTMDLRSAYSRLSIRSVVMG